MYIILDAARLSGAIDTAQQLQEKFLCLYKGNSTDSLSAVAPYLFVCNFNSELMSWYREKGWGNSWGVMTIGNFELEELQTHLRRFLMVRTEEGQELYFRFYDPRVLRIFLPTCDKPQLNEFFGPVEKFVSEDEDPTFALIFSLTSDGALKTERIPAEQFFGHTGSTDFQPNVRVEIVPSNEIKETLPPKRKWYFLDE